jgi:hypothetical protein
MGNVLGRLLLRTCARLGSPPGILLQALLSALCDRMAKVLIPTEMSNSGAERLANALVSLTRPPSGHSELPHAALKAGVGAVLARCRDASTSASTTGMGFLASLDPHEAIALVNAAALLVPVPRQQQHAPTPLAFAVEEAWVSEHDSSHRLPDGPDESVASQVKALSSRVSSLLASRSLSAAQVSTLLSAFARGTSRDPQLFRSIVARLSEFAGCDPADKEKMDARTEAHAGARRGAEDGLVASKELYLPLLAVCVRHRLHIDVLPRPLVARLQHPLFLETLGGDELVSLLWSMGWGVCWDAALWAAVVRCLHGKGLGDRDFDGQLAAADNVSARHILLHIQRDVMLLWAVAAAGRLLARSAGLQAPCASGQEAGAPNSHDDEVAQGAADGWMLDEEVDLCRGALKRIVGRWHSQDFEIRPVLLSFSNTPQLSDACTDMLRQALWALRLPPESWHAAEQDASAGGGKAARRSSKCAKGERRGRLMAFVDQHQHSALQDLEKQVLLRATHLDAMRCEASSHVRQDVKSVLASNGHTASVEHQKGFKAPAAAAAPATTSASKPPHDSKGGWLCLAASHSSHTADAPARTTVVQIYDKPDFLDSVPSADGFPGAGSVSSSTAASLGIGPRILNVRWRMWEEKIKAKYDVCILPLAADIWQECVEDAAQEVSLRNEEVGAYQRAPARSAFLKQLLQEAASTLPCSSLALPHADASEGEEGAETHKPLERGLAATAANGEGQNDAHLDSFSPGSMGGDSEGGGGDSSKDNDMEENEHVEGAGAGSGGSRAAGEDEKVKSKKLRIKEPKGMPRSSSRREKREEKKKGENGKKKQLWKIEFSQSKQRWYYFNSKTRERLWKAPEVPGWIIKSGSGKHRPYVGLKHYYYNVETGKSSYEPPVDRER